MDSFDIYIFQYYIDEWKCGFIIAEGSGIFAKDRFELAGGAAAGRWQLGALSGNHRLGGVINTG
jgi:hypothetical protein